MASFHDNPDTFSTLELFQNDETARAPEPSPVPSLVPTGFLSVPETCPGRDPEVHYKALAPEVVSDSGAVGQSRASSLRKLDFLTRKKIYAAALAVGLLVLIAIGLGVGLGHYQRIHSSPPANTRPPTGPANISSPTSPASPVQSSITQQILDDTSLAAVYTTSGDKHVFFQDPQGVIQQVIRTASDSQWIVKTNAVGILDARNSTPMAAQYINSFLELYYITANDTLSSRVFQEGIWGPPSVAFPFYTTAPKTRQLSIASSNSTVVLPAPESDNTALLFFENASGNVTALLNTGGDWIDISSNHTSEPRSTFSPIWSNNIDEISTSSSTLHDFISGTRLSAPFTLSAGNSSDLMVTTLICGDNCSATLWSNYYSYTNKSHGVFTSVSGDDFFTMSNQVAEVNTDGYTGSDIEIITGDDIFAVFINGTQPVTLSFGEDNQSIGGGTDSAPFGPFHYTRLASISTDGGSYLYHQINGTTIAEEQYLLSEDQWVISSYIIIPRA